MVLTIAHDEVFDLIAGLDSQAIVDFRPSASAQERVEDLIARSNAGVLTPEERKELDSALHLEHFMRMAKIRARQRLRSAQE